MAEPDTKELDELLDSLNRSAERFQTLWFSFLGLTLYLAVTALATTHRNLLLGEPQTLPLLNIKVELLPVIAPLLYFVFHFYLLMMLVLLARTAAEFESQLRKTLTGEVDQERYRARVENALFLQLLVGMKKERAGINGILLAFIALSTTVLAPLATLILMQMMFLPYHSFRITWYHREVVVADLVLILVMTYRCFYPRGLRKAPLVLGSLGPKTRWLTVMACYALLAVALCPVAYWLSFKEGRWAGEPQASFRQWRWWTGEPLPYARDHQDFGATANGVVFGLFPDRLKLRDEIIVGEQKLEETKKEIASRGGGFVPTIKLDERDLQAADLSRADLRGVSVNGTAMQGADLRQTRLDGARLSCDPQGDSQICAHLQGADLGGAQLQGANLMGAALQGARVFAAMLHGADLVFSQLQGAYLRNAMLEGANLASAQLQGADIAFAQLQGSVLRAAQLQGADLRGAQLQGADLTAAQLQGADLPNANMSEATLDRTLVFRTNVAHANLSASEIRSVLTDQVRLDDDYKVEPWNPADVDAWIAAATRFAQDGAAKAHIVARFARLKSDFQAADQDAADLRKWKSWEDLDRSRDPAGANYRQRLAKLLGDLACSPEGAPYVGLRLIRENYPVRAGLFVAGTEGYRLAALGDQLDVVRARMEDGRKNPEKCPGIVGFTDGDWHALEAIEPAQD